VTHLRKMMLEELQRRNLSKLTAECYLRAVEELALFYKRPCGPENNQPLPTHVRGASQSHRQPSGFTSLAVRLEASRNSGVAPVNDPATVGVGRHHTRRRTEAHRSASGLANLVPRQGAHRYRAVPHRRATWEHTRIASPSPIAGWFHSSTARLLSVGETPLTRIRNGS
jgi:hypothetical protein